MNKSDGKMLLKIARETIELWVKEKEKIHPQNYPEKFNEKTGVFVSIHTKSGELRGCIGYPEPAYPLIEALVDAAISACGDPRFEPVNSEELEQLAIEVSVLTKPELIIVKNLNEYRKKIKIGKDGLIIESGFHRGLLLPQVAVEWEWTAEEFLSSTCQKAGLPPDAWLDENTKIYRFGAVVFREK